MKYLCSIQSTPGFIIYFFFLHHILPYLSILALAGPMWCISSTVLSNDLFFFYRSCNVLTVWVSSLLIFSTILIGLWYNSFSSLFFSILHSPNNSDYVFTYGSYSFRVSNPDNKFSSVFLIRYKRSGYYIIILTSVECLDFF